MTDASRVVASDRLETFERLPNNLGQYADVGGNTPDIMLASGKVLLSRVRDELTGRVEEHWANPVAEGHIDAEYDTNPAGDHHRLATMMPGMDFESKELRDGRLLEPPRADGRLTDIALAGAVSQLQEVRHRSDPAQRNDGTDRVHKSNPEVGPPIQQRVPLYRPWLPNTSKNILNAEKRPTIRDAARVEKRRPFMSFRGGGPADTDRVATAGTSQALVTSSTLGSQYLTKVLAEIGSLFGMSSSGRAEQFETSGAPRAHATYRSAPNNAEVGSGPQQQSLAVAADASQRLQLPPRSAANRTFEANAGPQHMNPRVLGGVPETNAKAYAQSPVLPPRIVTQGANRPIHREQFQAPVMPPRQSSAPDVYAAPSTQSLLAGPDVRGHNTAQLPHNLVTARFADGRELQADRTMVQPAQTAVGGGGVVGAAFVAGDPGVVHSARAPRNFTGAAAAVVNAAAPRFNGADLVTPDQESVSRAAAVRFA